MSIALPSPHQTGKRFLDDSDDLQLQEGDCRVPFSHFNPSKRVRHLKSPGKRCGTGNNPAYTFTSSAVAALRSLFPHMSDKAISDVLAEFGDNVDGAIRALNELQLSAPGTSKQHEEQAQQRQGILGPPPAPTPPETAAAPELKAEEPRSADQWIDLLVEQMSAATDVADAKTRASGVLRAFEQAVLQHANAGRSAEADRENAVLKRAVAIQNARIQELQVKEAENADLKASMEAAKARIQALEMQNYSLQVHLKQAADSRDMAFCAAPKNPDVF